ncbi:MAG TPA: FAD-dependent oxidoreductase [Acidobacteriota bacterium]|nr:FAD-dependent oxidoreductase [Acidobacteriota bacterium]
MTEIQLTIDGQTVDVPAGSTILAAALAADIYVPTLCAHPSLPYVDALTGEPFVFRGDERVDSDDPSAAWDGCGLCSVAVEGEQDLVRACATEATPGMVVRTDTERVVAYRHERLAYFLIRHPHACLTCAQSEGCSLTQCSSNVAESERCCVLLGSCELQRLAQFIGVPSDLPKYSHQGLPKLTDEPLFDWNTELCIGCLRCVRACRDMRDVGAIAFVMKDGRPVVGTTVGPTRSESHCRFCGACVEVCPTGALLDKVRGVGEERERILVPCRNACPAGVDIPRFVRYIAREEPDEAAAVIRESLPFSFAPSYVCFHPCEGECRRGSINEPIAICQLKRFAADLDSGQWRARMKRLPATGKTVAVVGSGPAGLTAAYYLAKQGHRVTIFEALPEPGGMLRVGIPRFRYPAELLEKDIDEIRAVGVEIRTNAPIADADALQRLTSEYDAVFLGTGAHEPIRLEVPGYDLESVWWGVDFLRANALNGNLVEAFRGRRVVVIGGGNVAVDAARIALRLETADVSVVSLEAADALPAYDWEVREAHEEGIRFLHTWGIREIGGADGVPTGVMLKRCTQVFDEAGRFHPLYDETETQEVAADAVILAIGQAPSAAPFAACGLTGGGTITANETTLATDLPGVYAGGDVVSGPKSVIEAIAAGRQAAQAIDKALGGDGDITEQLIEAEPPSARLGHVDNFTAQPRAAMPSRDAAARSTSFALIEEGLSATSAVGEALRCLACDLRLLIDRVMLAPRTESILELSADVVAELPETSGVYQLLDEDRNVLTIKGVMNLREALAEVVADGNDARYFVYEEDPMYTKRESELIQKYLQEHGELPGGDDELDDLF